MEMLSITRNKKHTEVNINIMHREKSLDPEITMCKVKYLLIIDCTSANNECFPICLSHQILENTE